MCEDYQEWMQNNEQTICKPIHQRYICINAQKTSRIQHIFKIK